MTLPWGSTELDDRAYFDADPDRHVTPEARETADQDWTRTLAAVDGDAGLSIYQRMELDEFAFVDDFEPWDEP